MKQAFLVTIIVFVTRAIFSQTFIDSCENRPQIWFQHSDYFDMIDDTIYEKEIAPDMLTRWYNHEDWDHALNNMDVYSIHENLFKKGGAPAGMGAKFLHVLVDSFVQIDPTDTTALHIAYLQLILPILHAHDVELQIHTVGSKGDFVPWDMYGTENGTDSLPYPQNNQGLELVKNTLSLINGVCDNIFTDGYQVTQVKLQSVLSGHWKRGLLNNVYCALEYMKGVQENYPSMKFYMGDALMQRRDYNDNLGWKEAYETLHHTMINDQNGYDHLNFNGIRIEFNKNWADDILFENAQGWAELSDSGAVELIQGFGWEVGLEHNNPYADNEWEYEEIVLRTAAKLLELNLHCDFAVLHSDAAGGNGHAYPYYVAPEDCEPNDTPTFSSVLNKVFDFYYDEYSCNSNSVNDAFKPKNYNSINYPNPFHTTINIKYQLPILSQVNIIIQDMFGRCVISLLNSEQDAGLYNISWDGRNRNGNSVSAGTYICKFVVNDYVETTMLVLIK